jgi:LacI family transcriptional regulator
MPLTLEDIAKLAGVSRSTVSRVVNGDESVKDITRQKVQEVIHGLNFQPNIAARILAAGRTGVVGLVIPTGVTELFADPYFLQLIQGVTAACNANDYSVMLWLAEPAYERATIRKILHGGLLDGVIVSSTLMDDAIVQALYESKMPFILVGRHPTLDVNYLDVDNISGGRMATMHLLECGRKRIATITGPQNMIAGSDRYCGYCEALQSANLPVLSELVYEGDFTEESGYEGMKKLLPLKPDAAFIHSDTMAVGAIRAIHEAGLIVPNDIAIAGYDDSPVAGRITPGLTTVHQPTYAMGYSTFELLLKAINNPTKQIYQVLLSTELVIRSSSGAIGAVREEVIVEQHIQSK